jgi:hypothetical protein
MKCPLSPQSRHLALGTVPEAVKQFFSPLVEYLARVKGETQLSVYFAKVSSVWVM